VVEGVVIDLRERIRKGDVEALLDPALSLHLLGDGPTADWWHEGALLCARSLIRLGVDVREAHQPTTSLRELGYWALGLLRNAGLDEHSWDFESVEFWMSLRPGHHQYGDALDEILDVGVRYLPQAGALRELLGLVRRLHGAWILPGFQSLVVLEHYERLSATAERNTMSNEFQKPTIGRTVHYTMPDGQIRPAVVVRAWDHEPGGSYPPGVVNLQVLLDGSNDRISEKNAEFFSEEETKRGQAWRTSVHHSEESKPNTWRWPPRV
jgi:hypothetical protein